MAEQSAVLSPPEPGLDAEKIIGRARAMAPMLRDRAAEIEAAREIPADVNRAFIDAGFYRILQPARFGGYELGLETFVAAMREIARGDASCGWVLTFNAAHVWHLCSFAEPTQVEGFGPDGDFRSPLLVMPQGRAVPENGGFRISGNWDYNSGGANSNWLMVTALVMGDDGDDDGAPTGDLRLCLLSAEQYGDHDNWHVMGMKGTGSKQAVVTDLWLPEARTVSLPAWREAARAPGHGAHANPLYRIHDFDIFFIEMGAVALGIGDAVIDALTDYARVKRQPLPPFATIDGERKTHRHMGEALAKLQAAEACITALMARANDKVERVSRGESIVEDEPRRSLMLFQEAALSVHQALEAAFSAGGTSGARQGQLLERLYRDFAMLRTHFLMDVSRTRENLGALHFGFEPYSRM